MPRGARGDGCGHAGPVMGPEGGGEVEGARLSSRLSDSERARAMVALVSLGVVVADESAAARRGGVRGGGASGGEGLVVVSSEDGASLETRRDKMKRGMKELGSHRKRAELAGLRVLGLDIVEGCAEHGAQLPDCSNLLFPIVLHSALQEKKVPHALPYAPPLFFDRRPFTPLPVPPRAREPYTRSPRNKASNHRAAAPSFRECKPSPRIPGSGPL